MYRLTKLPELKQIWCKHSGRPEIKIALFGVLVHSSNNDDEYLVYRMNKHILRTQRQFKIKRYEENNSNNDVDYESELHLKNIGIFQINLKFLEMAFILCLVISFVAFMTAVFSTILRDRIHTKWLFILTLVVICTPVGIAYNMILVLIYKWISIQDIKQRMRMTVKDSKMSSIMFQVFYVFTFVISIVFLIGVYLCKDNEEPVYVFQWFSASFCSSSLVAMIWCLVSHLLFIEDDVKTISSDFESNSMSETVNTTSSDNI